MGSEKNELAPRVGAVDDAEAARGIDLAIRQREAFAPLSANGSGKTTTAEILEGFRLRDAGEVKARCMVAANRTTTPPR